MFAQLKEAKEGGALNKAGSQSAYWLLPKTTSTTASQVHPAPTKIQIISCASHIDTIDTVDTSPKLFALYFSSGWFQARITIWLFPRECKEASSQLSAPSFSSLRKTLLRNTLTERWACYWLSCFKSGLRYSWKIQKWKFLLDSRHLRWQVVKQPQRLCTTALSRTCIKEVQLVLFSTISFDWMEVFP